MPEAKRLLAIAKNFKVPEKELKAAVAKGGAEAEKIGPLLDAGVRAALADTALSSRLKRVRIDTTGAKAVAYVTFEQGTAEHMDREICLAAIRTAKVSPIVGVVKVEVLRPASSDTDYLFEGLLDAERALTRMDEARLPDFATTRYIKLFENVKRAE